MDWMALLKGLLALVGVAALVNCILAGHLKNLNRDEKAECNRSEGNDESGVQPDNDVVHTELHRILIGGPRY